MSVSNLLLVLPYQNLKREVIDTWARRVTLAGKDPQPGKSDGRHLAHLAGRAALGLAFSHLKVEAWVRPVPPRGYLEVTDSKGKALKGVFANVSHTDRLAVVAVAGEPVGVDVEKLSRSTDKVLGRVASPEEQRSLDGFKLQLEGEEVAPGLVLWCGKEAFLKATGLGLAGGAMSVSMARGGQGLWVVHSQLNGAFPLGSPMVSFLRYQGYLIALCSERETVSAGFSQICGSLENGRPGFSAF